MEYKDFQCVCVGAKDCKAPVSINIQGDAGCIHSDAPANVYDEFILCLNNGETEHISLNQGMPRLYYELRTFVDMVNENNWEAHGCYCQHTLEVQSILDEARRQVGILQ
jgi:hypothetical protein